MYLCIHAQLFGRKYIHIFCLTLWTSFPFHIMNDRLIYTHTHFACVSMISKTRKDTLGKFCKFKTRVLNITKYNFHWWNTSVLYPTPNCLFLSIHENIQILSSYFVSAPIVMSAYGAVFSPTWHSSTCWWCYFIFPFSSSNFSISLSLQ